jgi:hypothetical protein
MGLATVICFDTDVDISLVPASDWQALAEAHSPMAISRAVENGVALVLQLGAALRLRASVAADSH